MKKYTVLSLMLIFISCREYRAVMAEKTEFHKGNKMYFVDKDKSILTVSLNNAEHQVVFDTGAGATMIYRPKFTLEEKNKITERTVYGFQKQVKLKAFDYSIDSMTSGLWTTRRKYLYVKEKEPVQCIDDAGVDGILGCIIESDDILEINYQMGYIQYVDLFNKEGFTALDAKFSGMGTFTVKMEVNGIRDYFLFDTGNKTITLLDKKKYQTPGNKLYTIKTLNKSIGNDAFPICVDVYEVPVRLGSTLVFDQPVGIDSRLNKSMLSLNFIKKFNWFIDRKNQKVYCKPIDSDKLFAKKELTKKDMIFASALRDKLLVSYMNFESGFEIGSEIISVKGQKVTPENICTTMQLLNQAENWPALDVVATSPKKQASGAQ